MSNETQSGRSLARSLTPFFSPFISVFRDFFLRPQPLIGRLAARSAARWGGCPAVRRDSGVWGGHMTREALKHV